MRTIGRSFTGSTPDYATDCDYCGVKWHRSELKLDAAGLLACPDDAEGRVAVDLDRENAAGPTPQALPRGRTRR